MTPSHSFSRSRVALLLIGACGGEESSIPIKAPTKQDLIAVLRLIRADDIGKLN